jgi:hypothetical protein
MCAIGRVIQDFYFSQRLTSGPTDISSFDVTSLLFRDFDVIATDEPAQSMF